MPGALAPGIGVYRGKLRLVEIAKQGSSGSSSSSSQRLRVSDCVDNRRARRTGFGFGDSRLKRTPPANGHPAFLAELTSNSWQRGETAGWEREGGGQTDVHSSCIYSYWLGSCFLEIQDTRLGFKKVCVFCFECSEEQNCSNDSEKLLN
ncbi:hypothetical protein K0M31_019439 [Melipona bicolor]|uniref:Uncharacterized protein n=1 Tax=Melipona bicolor TaxID=60889 RepID=A0AA40G2X5_9HYME|nr:hypothetical protein K0M31_019439 [Melipona bicolor]